MSLHESDRFDGCNRFAVGIAEGQGAAVSNRRRMESVGSERGFDGPGSAPRFEFLKLKVSD